MTQYLTRKEVYTRLWADACRHDGLDPTNKVVIFSDDNPFAVRLREYSNLPLLVNHREVACYAVDEIRRTLQLWRCKELNDPAMFRLLIGLARDCEEVIEKIDSEVKQS